MENSTVKKLKEDLKINNSLSTLKYRKWFRENQINQKLSPWIHPFFNFGALTITALITFNYSFSMGPLDIKTFLLFPLTLILGNLVVFLLHRYPLHRRYKAFPFPYDEHTVKHHRYFDYSNITLTGPEEFENIFFPWFIIASFILFICPLFFGLGFLYNGVATGLFFVFCACFYFTLYEVVHLSCHLEEGHWWLTIPGLKSMREHHRLHHHPGLMNRYNFCIVYPLFDYILGTKYKNTSIPEEKVEDHYKDVMKNIN